MKRPLAKLLSAGLFGLALSGPISGPAWADSHGVPTDWTAAPACTGKNAAKKAACQPLDMSHLQLAFDEEFDKLPPSLAKSNAAGPWVVGRHAPLYAGETYAWAGDALAYSVSNGVLDIHGRDLGGTYRMGDIEMVQAWQDGYWEVRLRGPQVPIHFGAWLLSYENGRNDATGGHAEVDMVEQYGPNDPNDHSSSHDWPGARTDFSSGYASLYSPRTEARGSVAWHTYGLLATEDAFTVFRDGKQLGTIARQPLQRRPLYLLLSLFGFAGEPPAADVQVDYVRVYTPK